MNNFKKCLIWYKMSSKRLLHKWSFILLLLMIPAVIPIANSMMSEESGIVKVVLCAEKETEATKRIIDSLNKREGVIHFSFCSTYEDAERKVKSGKADAAWVFVKNFDEILDEYGKDPTAVPLVKIIERESTVSLRLSREILYSAMFRDVSYSLYKNFSFQNIVPKEQVSEESVKEIYTELEKNDSIIEISRLNGGKIKEKVNYLTTPIRGLLSMVVLLCGLAAAMYFLEDQKKGKYNWLPHNMRIAPAFALCLSAAVFSGVAVLIALLLGGYSTNILYEIVSMMLFIIMVVGFSLVFCLLFSSPVKLGAALPGIMIISIVLSPIFFYVDSLKFISRFLPTYHYLHAVYDMRYWLFSLIYCVIIYGVVILLNNFKNTSPKRNII